MEQVKVFSDEHMNLNKMDMKKLERQVNSWLMENSEKIEILDRQVSTAVAASAGLCVLRILTITIFYTPKH